MPDGRRKQALTHYLEQAVHQRLTILPYDREAALWHAEERARLAAQGRTPPFIDGQIAAIAMVNRLTLVTIPSITVDTADIGPHPLPFATAWLPRRS